MNLASCGIGKDGAASLCGVIHSLRFLKSLLLSRNAIPSDALSTLARTLSSRRSLELLDLSSTNAGDAGAHALLPLLQSAGCPRELRLKDNAIKSSGALNLLHAVALSHSMQVLDLSNNSIDDSVSTM
jgi:Ran GTPase-activating protein (RanGAP) involved in mRNA processing and transport